MEATLRFARSVAFFVPSQQFDKACGGDAWSVLRIGSDHRRGGDARRSQGASDGIAS